MAAAGGNNCAAGAAAGVVGESIGALVYDNGNGFSRQSTIATSQIAGALAAAMAAGPDDGDSVFAGGNVGLNASANNTTGTFMLRPGDPGYDEIVAAEKLPLKVTYKLTPMGVSEIIENYTGQELTWEVGGEARFKLQGHEFETSVLGANTIGMANAVGIKEMYLVGQPLNAKPGYTPNFVQEGGWISTHTNARGMNAMSVMHDKWGENPIIAKPGVLQFTIIPAIPITYYGLIGKSIRNLYE